MIVSLYCRHTIVILKAVVLVGGIDMMAQAIALGKRPHIVVGTPGRVVDHLSNTKVGSGLRIGRTRSGWRMNSSGFYVLHVSHLVS